MKRILFTTIFILSTSILFAQNADTLNVPLGKYGFIKIGDRVYKVITTLEIAPVEPTIKGGLLKLWPGNIIPAGVIDDSTMNSIRLADACKGIKVVYK